MNQQTKIRAITETGVCPCCLREIDKKTKIPDIGAGHLWVSPERAEATWKGRTFDVTKIEIRMLTAFCARPGTIIQRDQMLTACWGDSLAALDVDVRNVDSHVKRLRLKIKKVDPDFDQIVTVYGIGYKWRAS